MNERKTAKAAAVFCDAIKEIAGKPENLQNLECYLSTHFSEWLSVWANTPEDIASEMREFASAEYC